MMVTVQLLVAAINPTTSGTTQVFGLYFPDGNALWNPTHTCADIVTDRLPRLIGDFRTCDAGNGASQTFPGICGEATKALEGLKKIDKLAQDTPSDRMQAVVMFTDGEIADDSNERKTVIKNLKEHGVKTLIAAGLQLEGAEKINRETLKEYAITRGTDSTNNAIVEDDAAQLSLKIIDRLEQENVLCPEHGKRKTYC